MTAPEMRLERISSLNSSLGEAFELAQVDADGRPIFKTKTGHFLRIDSLGGAYNAIVAEHAESMGDVKRNRFEDGALLFMDELTEEEMFSAILAEARGG